MFHVPWQNPAMSPTRRDFLKATAATAAVLASPQLRVDPAGQVAAPNADPFELELANEALTAARGAGASYADARVGRYRQQAIATRERQVQSVNDGESFGIGIRTLINGCWGFAATSQMTKDGVRKAALEAAFMSRAAQAVHRRRVELAPSKPVTGTWITPVRRDPLDVPLEDKVELLLATNEAALLSLIHI